MKRLSPSLRILRHVVLMVVALCHGTQFATDNAHHVMNLYGETLEEYLEEFANA